MPEFPRDSKQIATAISAAFDNLLVRGYARIRFRIIRSRMLDEIAQHLPSRGRVLDVGCGFGLFAMYFAFRLPNTRILGIDKNAGRIRAAERAAQRLKLNNVEFVSVDAREFLATAELDGAYLIDLLHHMPPQAVEPLLRHIAGSLRPGACLVVKDIDNRPWWKVGFTWLLDKVVDLRAPVHYWSRSKLETMLAGCGLQTVCHPIQDILPYPHVLYVGRKPLEAVGDRAAHSPEVAV